jgi:ketosteroid isomerase-like protein
MTTTRETARNYFTAWDAQDFDRLAGVLADDVDFVGPMGTAHGVEQALGGLRGVRGMVDKIAVTKIWTDGPDAITWFEFRRAGTDPVSTVNWSHVEDGRITRIRVTFDPRPLIDG